MRDRTPWSRVSLLGTLLIILTLTAGCHFAGDTSGYKPEQQQSKAQINQQIAQIKANSKMPAGIKAMALKKLNASLASAR